MLRCQPSTNLHKSTSHFQLLWTLNEQASKRSSSFPIGVGRRAARAKRAGPVVKVNKNDKPQHRQSGWAYSVDRLQEDRIRTHKENPGRCEFADNGEQRLGAGDRFVSPAGASRSAQCGQGFNGNITESCFRAGFFSTTFSSTGFCSADFARSANQSAPDSTGK